MYKNVTVTLALGFLMGLGLVSCASVESSDSEGDRSPASAPARLAKSNSQDAEKLECNPGEERNESGDCARPHEFDRPFHRGGR